MPAGAVSSCPDDLFVNWTVCGAVVASSRIPTLLVLPDPTFASLTIAASRLTAPGDEAAQVPMGLLSSGGLRVQVGYATGALSDMTSDPRVIFSLGSGQASCGAISMLPSPTLHVLSGAKAANCTGVTIVATLYLNGFSLVSLASLPIIYVSHLSLAFVGFPSSNAGTAVSSLYQIGCLADVYQRASTRVAAHLTDGSVHAIIPSSLSSSAPSVVAVSGARVDGVAPGVAVIVAAFGRVQAAATLTVSNSAAVAEVVSWSVPLHWSVAGGTLALERSGTLATSVTVRYTTPQGTFSYSGLHSADYAGWLEAAAMVRFNSSAPAAISVSEDGTLTLLDNAAAPVSLTAVVACPGLPATAVSTAVSAVANLQPGEMDVDLGEEAGLQFGQESPGAPLRVKVRLRPMAGYFMTSFQIRLGALDTSILSSASTLGGRWVDYGAYSGIVDQMGDPPSEVVLAASNPTSTQQSAVEIGEVFLAVVGSGVTLIDGVIQSMLVRTRKERALHSEVQGQPIVAGRGYAVVSAARRTRRLMSMHLAAAGATGGGGLATVPAPRPALDSRRVLQTACDPCAARVWGDFNGDCKFLSSDVDYLWQLILNRLEFVDGASPTDPLDTPSWTVHDASGCAEFVQLQANPSPPLAYY